MSKTSKTWKHEIWKQRHTYTISLLPLSPSPSLTSPFACFLYEVFLFLSPSPYLSPSLFLSLFAWPHQIVSLLDWVNMRVINVRALQYKNGSKLERETENNGKNENQKGSKDSFCCRLTSPIWRALPSASSSSSTSQFAYILFVFMWQNHCLNKKRMREWMRKEEEVKEECVCVCVCVCLCMSVYVCVYLCLCEINSFSSTPTYSHIHHLWSRQGELRQAFASTSYNHHTEPVYRRKGKKENKELYWDSESN